MDLIKINNYINSFLSYPHDFLNQLESEHMSDRINIQPNIGLQGLHLLKSYILAKNAKQVIEIGSCIGQSTAFIALILKRTGGMLTTIEIDKRFIPEIEHNLHEIGVENIVTLINDDASNVMKSLDTKADIIVIDANKPLYPTILEDLVSHLKTGGVIFADDTLFKPLGFKPRLSDPMDQYNKMVFEHPMLESTIIPVGDGITISVKTT